MEELRTWTFGQKNKINCLLIIADFKAAANKASGSSACRNWGYREVTDPNSWGFQIAIAPYGSNMACHWVIYNPYPSTTLRINFGYFHVSFCFNYKALEFCTTNLTDGRMLRLFQILRWSGHFLPIHWNLGRIMVERLVDDVD